MTDPFAAVLTAVILIGVVVFVAGVTIAFYRLHEPIVRQRDEMMIDWLRDTHKARGVTPELRAAYDMYRKSVSNPITKEADE